MVGPPQHRLVLASPRTRVIVGTICPQVIVGSARLRDTRDGTPRLSLAVEESPRPRVVFGTPPARVIVGSPGPRVIVSSPWPVAVVETPRPRDPIGSPWPRVIVGTPRSRVIVGSPRAQVAGANQASRLLWAPLKAADKMNILAPVRRDRVLAELPQCLKKEAALHAHKDFHPRVTCACQEHRTGTVGFKISKVIVVGDLSVGKTCLINRFCKNTFDKNYKATIGVDFEMERFEVLGIPFSLQLWDTAGQERFKCIASTYYRGAQAIIIVFNLNDVTSLEHSKQWLADALKENDPSNVLLFLVGSKKDLSTPAQYVLMERDALKVAQEMKAEYWAVSSLTGENVQEFFFRVAALTFEANVLAELEKSGARRIGDIVRINSDDNNLYLTASKKKPMCCP